MRRLVVIAVIVALAVGVALGCNALFGIGDYSVVDDAAGGDGPGGEGAVDCNAAYDFAAGQCYPCAPTADPQFLNACTGAACVPFDDKARVPRLSPDGSLPPVQDLPPPDAGGGG